MSAEVNTTESGLERRIAELRVSLRLRDRQDLAQKTGAIYQDGRFLVEFWHRQLSLAADKFVAIDLQSGHVCDTVTQALLAYYFFTSNGMPMVNEWIAFSELPDGQFYASAFQGYTGNKLENLFGNDISAFKQAAEALNGRPQPIGDAAYSFQMMPRVPVALVCWLGDEDFPSSYRVLFDKSIAHHLPTDACAILGSMLTAKLSKIAVENVVS